MDTSISSTNGRPLAHPHHMTKRRHRPVYGRGWACPRPGVWAYPHLAAVWAYPRPGTTMARLDLADVRLALRCSGRQVRCRKQHDLLLLAAEVDLESAVGPEYIVVLVVIKVATGAFVIDLRSRI
jgi:hypothetical protein